MHPLDRPVWSALSTLQAPLAQGNALARRYRPDINLFAATSDDGDEAIRALIALLGPNDRIYLIQKDEIRTLPGLVLEHAALGVQMVLERPPACAASAEGVVVFGEPDVPEMIALAHLTNPGPFLPRTNTMGRFIGVRRKGRLVAMAGERMRLPGFVEVSGVCTHPDFRGEGLASRLSALVAGHIAERGDTPFLHAWKANTAAISLYGSLGFTMRAEVQVAVLVRDASGCAKERIP
jgi:predicted GNAT family acetyltransferase